MLTYPKYVTLGGLFKRPHIEGIVRNYQTHDEETNVT